MVGKMTAVHCGKCDMALSECPDIPSDARTPCPQCGSLSRKFDVELRDGVVVASSLGYKAKHGGRGKPFVEGFSGASWSRKFLKWMHLSRVIDRENDSYKEVVTDSQTGEEIHRCEEPLSQHIGHGDDKRQK